jgi:hypothetical protein
MRPDEMEQNVTLEGVTHTIMDMYLFCLATELWSFS